MAKKFRVKSKNRPVKSRQDRQEFGGGKKGIIICPQCKAVYYKKSWHHSMLNLKSPKEKSPVNFVLCPACQMIKKGQYEGKILINNIPVKKKEELLNLINNYCEKAYSTDPLDRLIAIKDGGNNIVVTVTENELASKLTRKIKEAFKNVDKKVIFSSEPGDTALAVIDFFE